MISSLSTRLLLSVGVLLLVFFGMTIVVLEVAFRQAGEQAQQDILDSQIMALLAAAEPNDNHELVMPPDLPEPRYGTPGSGLYAELRNEDKQAVWQSRSAIGMRLPRPAAGSPGEQRLARLTLEDGTPVMTATLAVTWEFAEGELRPYTFHVTESLDSLNAQIAAYRRQLFGWFFAVALVMLLAIAVVMRSVLRPLRQIEGEIGDIESGGRAALSGNYPTELKGVARNMNLLIGSERGRSERYRQTLDNLAHSLKTPLAAMRAVLDETAPGETRERQAAQIERMNDIVRYQLRKPARLLSEGIGLPTLAVRTELQRLADGLSKVYRDKAVSIHIEVSEGAEFRGDRGDFLELAGNLLDNACKWCEREIQVTVSAASHADGRQGIRLTVSDDGRGIPEELAQQLLERGMRLDESAPGHGIGLAVVRDIAANYGGTVRIARSSAGGAEFSVDLFATTTGKS
ncbi:ATP-binding protein [Woeseia oceani]|uniref:ATP-binding protein n=1 Tax=Woeseia oceani TaxID=1548547 RepID=UPI0012EA828C|nr:ATP-binding protein [Woeseia oceani]